MQASNSIVNNENGSVIVVSMMVLVLLTIIGIAATNNSSFESQIIGNEHRYQIDFYVADSGWKEGAMWLEDSGGPPPKKNPGTSEIVRNWGDDDANDPPPGIQDVLTTPDNQCHNDGIDNNGDGTIDETGERCLSKYGVPYWFQVEWIKPPDGTPATVAGSGGGWRDFDYTVRSNANRTQEIEVLLSKIFKVGY